MFVHTASIRCSPLFSGEVHFCRRKTSNKIITSDHCGFAGVRPPTTRSPPASIRSPELSYPAQICLPMSTWLIGAGSFLRLGGSLPEEIAQKNHHLRPQRLRRSSAVRRASSSGEHSLAGVDLAGTVCLPMSTWLIGAGSFLRLGGSLPEEIAQKNHHLRPRRLRRTTAARNASSSGEHSLAGAELAGTPPLPMSGPLIGAEVLSSTD